MSSREHHGFIYGVLAALANSAIAVFAKLASPVPTETMVFFRCAISLLLFLPFCRGKVEFSFASIPPHLLRGGVGLMALYCYFFAVKNLPLVNAISLSNTTPLFMPLIVLLWMKLMVSKRRLFALFVGFLGILCILRPTPDRFFDLASWAGLAGGLLAAISLLGVRQLSKKTTTETILLYYFTLSTILSFFPMFFAWEPIKEPRFWIDLGAMGMLAAYYQYAMTKSLTHAPASKVTVTIYLNVVFSALAGWWIFGEVPSYWAILGALLVIGGGVLVLLDKEPPRNLKT